MGRPESAARQLNAFLAIARDLGQGVAPEEVDYQHYVGNGGGGGGGAGQHNLAYPLRPEVLEAVFHLHASTQDASWLYAAESILDFLQASTATGCGFASVRQLGSLELADEMPSYFLSETLKYLHWIFSADEGLGLGAGVWGHGGAAYLLTTEAHLIDLAQVRRIVRQREAAARDESKHKSSSPAADITAASGASATSATASAASASATSALHKRRRPAPSSSSSAAATTAVSSPAVAPLALPPCPRLAYPVALPLPYTPHFLQPPPIHAQQHAHHAQHAQQRRGRRERQKLEEAAARIEAWVRSVRGYTSAHPEMFSSDAPSAADKCPLHREDSADPRSTNARASASANANANAASSLSSRPPPVKEVQVSLPGVASAFSVAVYGDGFRVAHPARGLSLEVFNADHKAILVRQEASAAGAGDEQTQLLQAGVVLGMQGGAHVRCAVELWRDDQRVLER